VKTLRYVPWKKVYFKIFLKEFNVNFSRPCFVVGVDVRHETVARAIDTFTDDTAVLFLALCMLVCNVPLEACL
jgi:hypothetical protein